MTRRRAVAWSAAALLLVGGAAAATYYLPRWLAPAQAPPPVEVAAQPANPRIKATLYYVSDDGLHLVPHEREVAFGEGVVEQARLIVEAQLEPAPAPLVSPVPAGTTLKAVYVSAGGQVFVDLSGEISTAHPGGAISELLTVYAIVDVLTTNLPAVVAVQLLVDGRQVDTIAGHVDLRRPLVKSASWIQAPESAAVVAPAPAVPTSVEPAPIPAVTEPPKR